jgi:hypothetical protein
MFPALMNGTQSVRRDPLKELCVYLESVRQRGGFRSLALADSEGLLIAGAGKYSECEELSALSALRVSGPSHVLGRFPLLGSEVLLCAPEQGSSDVVTHVRRACERILGFARPRVSH